MKSSNYSEKGMKACSDAKGVRPASTRMTDGFVTKKPPAVKKAMGNSTYNSK